jgi:hypothetical protein
VCKISAIIATEVSQWIRLNRLSLYQMQQRPLRCAITDSQQTKPINLSRLLSHRGKSIRVGEIRHRKGRIMPKKQKTTLTEFGEWLQNFRLLTRFATSFSVSAPGRPCLPTIALSRLSGLVVFLLKGTVIQSGCLVWAIETCLLCSIRTELERPNMTLKRARPIRRNNWAFMVYEA